MKKIAGLVIGLLTLANLARADSVTLGASVALNGTFFTDDDGWAPGLAAAPADLVDGVYVPQFQQWNIDSIWWNGVTNPGNSIVITLDGMNQIDGFKVQADDNDAYLIEYLGGDSAWHSVWNIGPVFTFGLDFRQVTLGAAITTNMLRVTATGGDGYYAVAEVEAFGERVPDHGPAGLLLAGALGLLAATRRRLG